MAHAIPHTVPARDPQAELHARLLSAPAEHAEALLAAYDVLQGLNDSGVFDLLRGALGSKDKLIDLAVGSTRSPESVATLRNLILLSKMLGAIEPEALRRFTQAAPQALNMIVRQPEPPGLWRLMKDFVWNRNFRRGLSAVNTMLEVLGRNLSRDDASRAVSRADSRAASSGTATAPARPSC
jgi:uncharacterized protein YjgD (DUF1641 family)